MMASEAADAATERLGFSRLRRLVTHRTSEPTNELIRMEVALAREARGGEWPPADAVIFAALRLAGRDRKALHEEIRKIQGEMFDQRIRPPKAT